MKTGIKTDNVNDAVVNNLSGRTVKHYHEAIFHRIHTIPNTLNLGSITQESSKTIEVWNAFFDSKTLSGVSSVGLEGINASHINGLTGEFPGLSSRVFDVNIGLDGPTDVNGSLVFDFNGVKASVKILGKRLVLWSFEPNWAESPVEIYEYLTDTFISYDNTEQRESLRDEPRFSSRYQFMVQKNEARSLRGLQYALQSGKVTIPNWISNTKIPATQIKNKKIFCDTATLEIESGESVVIIKDYSSYDVKTVSEVNSDHLVLTDAVEDVFKDSVVTIAKAQVWAMQESFSVSSYNDELSVLRPTLNFDISSKQKPLAGISEPVVSLYKSLPIFDFVGNRVTDFDYNWSRKVENLDNNTGIRHRFDESKIPNIDLKMTFDLYPRVEINKFKGFMDAVKGTAMPFWCETFNQDMIISNTISLGDFTLEIQDVGYKGFYFKDLENRDIAITLNNGTKFYREIKSVVTTENNTEVLTLNDAFPIEILAEDVERISFLKYSRFKSDKFQYNFINDQYATITKIIKGLRYDI